MSTTEALQLQIDYLHHQLHRLEMENDKLRVEVSISKEKGAMEVNQLQQEICELHHSLHEAQEREVSSNDLLNNSHVRPCVVGSDKISVVAPCP